MKKEYKTIELEIIFLSNEDIVTTSITDDPFGDWEK